jgi:hypothetical protein
VSELKLHNGTIAENGDTVCWDVWDVDDNHTWLFEGIYRDGVVIYLGGGSDQGSARGKELSVEDVIAQAYNNDCARGVWKRETIRCSDCNTEVDYTTAPNHDCVE